MTSTHRELMSRISSNPDVLVGKPTIRGLRISVEQILRALAAGVPEADLLADFPDLEPEDIRAAICYAADRISQERVFPVVPGRP